MGVNNGRDNDLEVANPTGNCLEQDNYNVDYIIRSLGGTFSRFHILNFVIYSIALCFCGMASMSYVFTAMNLDYRCNIAECDLGHPPKYDAPWLSNAIPSTCNSKLAKCQRYERHSDFGGFERGFCEKEAFNTSSVVRCGQDGFIYKTDEVSIANEFNITCAENEWLLVSVGTIHNIGRLVCMPLSGILSDKIGRRMMLMLGILSSSIAGIVQSFSTNYWMFIVCEFVNAGVLCSAYPAAVLLCMEWSEPKHCELTSSMAIITYPIGFAFTGFIAASTHHFRLILRYVFGSGFIAVALLFFSSESLRWMLVKGKLQRLEQAIDSAAKLNNLKISPKIWEVIRSKCADIQRAKQNTTTNTRKHTNEISVFDLFKHKSLICRFLIVSFCWISGTFIVYGVSIISVSLYGDKYVNFIIIGLGGVPASIVVIMLLKYVGRRKSTCISLLITSVAIFSTKLIPIEHSSVALMTFLLGRIGSSVALSTVYIFSSELWPTSTRHTLMGLSSTLGRIGAATAPLTPLLANISELLPFATFGLMALAASALILLLPETFNRDMLDTVEETLHIGQKHKVVKNDE